jgi:hypothetical protein
MPRHHFLTSDAVFSLIRAGFSAKVECPDGIPDFVGRQYSRKVVGAFNRPDYRFISDFLFRQINIAQELFKVDILISSADKKGKLLVDVPELLPRIGGHKRHGHVTGYRFEK